MRGTTVTANFTKTRLFRWPLTLIILYGLGLILSVALSWAFVLLDPAQPDIRNYLHVGPRAQYYLATRTRGTGREMWTARWVPRDSYALPDAPPWVPMPAERENYRLTEAWGWPRPCLMQHGYLFQTGWEADREQSFTWNYRGKTYQFPTRIIWTRLAINAAVLGVGSGLAIIAAVATVRAARVWLRRRRGKCPQCGYDISTLRAGAPCPECGSPQTQADVQVR
jgi:hypothetical protein